MLRRRVAGDWRKRAPCVRRSQGGQTHDGRELGRHDADGGASSPRRAADVRRAGRRQQPRPDRGRRRAGHRLRAHPQRDRGGDHGGHHGRADRSPRRRADRARAGRRRGHQRPRPRGARPGAASCSSATPTRPRSRAASAISGSTTPPCSRRWSRHRWRRPARPRRARCGGCSMPPRRRLPGRCTSTSARAPRPSRWPPATIRCRRQRPARRPFQEARGARAAGARGAAGAAGRAAGAPDAPAAARALAEELGGPVLTTWKAKGVDRERSSVCSSGCSPAPRPRRSASAQPT